MPGARARAACFAAVVLGGCLAPPTALAASPAVDAPIEPYPVALPSPVGTSRPPDFLDEDETVRAKIQADGSVASLVDDAIFRIRGSGDYAIFLPARVTEIANLGGDSPPGLQDSHVSFLGNVIGQGQLGVEATLDKSQVGTLPLTVALGYSAGGAPINPAALGSATAPVTVTIRLNNLTAVPHEFSRGNAAAPVLAPILENLRQAAQLYTPETDLQALFPLPAALPLTPPATTERHDTYVPLAITATVKLPTSATVVDGGGADMVVDSRGSRLTWLKRLPEGLEAGGALTLSFTFSSAHPRLPAIEVRADPVPLPPTALTPPGGGPWATYLAGVKDGSAAAVLAQEAAASMHRIGELAQPLGRPGPGPVKVKYAFILDSGAAPVVRPPAPPPVRGQPWLIVLVAAAVGFGAVNAALAWSRH
ncbi:MAG: hypothetical protein QOK05_1827 [Chloroflexota bacterium]|jgi:hypothetical protein|nr:hypothetical protein [Chloroflexota bacterium]